MLGNSLSNVSCYLAEKEIPIPVKQEPAESKEPIIEADKSKQRYKKYLPPIPPSPVSLFSALCIKSSKVKAQL